MKVLQDINNSLFLEQLLPTFGWIKKVMLMVKRGGQGAMNELVGVLLALGAKMVPRPLQDPSSPVSGLRL
eukprot:3479647-Karenia_brevis.AAC.1